MITLNRIQGIHGDRMQRSKPRKMRDWIAVHAIYRGGAGYHKQTPRRAYDPRDELLDYEDLNGELDMQEDPVQESQDKIPQNCKDN